MKFDKETLIALIVCVAVLIAWPFAAKFFSSNDQKAAETAGIEETVKKLSDVMDSVDKNVTETTTTGSVIENVAEDIKKSVQQLYAMTSQ